MNFLRSCMLTASMLAMSGPALAATNLTGNYLLTLSGHPSSVNGALLCAVLVENGSTLNFVNGGTLTLYNSTGQSISGVWFTKNHGVTFEASQGTNFLTFSGLLGTPQITNTTWIEVNQNQPLVGGTFTAQKGACSPPAS